MPLELRTAEEQARAQDESRKVTETSVEPQQVLVQPAVQTSDLSVKNSKLSNRPSLSSLLNSKADESNKSFRANAAAVQSSESQKLLYEAYDWQSSSRGLIQDLQVMFPELDVSEGKLRLTSGFHWLISGTQTYPEVIDDNLVTGFPNKLSGNDFAQVWKLLANRIKE